MSNIFENLLFKIKSAQSTRLLLLIVLLLVGIPAFSSTISYAETALPMLPDKGVAGWLGPGGPIAPPDLKGKVVLYDFWDYTCVNCIRTFPHLNLLYRTYKNKGLVIVGIHSPEFSFASLPSRVHQAILQYSLQFPVVLDRNQILWNKFHNHYWPADYLYDSHGHLVYHSFGEGGYAELEQKIRDTLHLVTLNERSHTSKEFPEGLTPELYAGYDRGELGNKSGYHIGTVADYSTTHLTGDRINLRGAWAAHSNHLASGNAKGHFFPSITVLYHGTGVNAVLKRSSENPDRREPVLIQVDGKQVRQKYAGKDLLSNSSGTHRQSMIAVHRARMYSLVSGQPFGLHRIDLFFPHEGTEIYTLTFNP